MARCMPDNYFVWGFSCLLPYVIVTRQLAWTFGMVLAWTHANRSADLLFKFRMVRGIYHTTADLAEAIKDVLEDQVLRMLG